MRSRLARALVVCAAVLVVAGLLAYTLVGRRPAPRIAGVPDQVDFNFHVKPLLSDRCFACHGPDDRQRKAGLRLDVQEAALSELTSGHRAIVPGKPGRSELVRRITSTDPKVMMPEPSSHLTLDEVEKATLVRWIEQGAVWQPHWSFTAPTKPVPPEVAAPTRARNAIDRFVLAALDRRGWQPSPEAPRETLIRRLTFDLTGLPPSIAEVDAFLADDSPQAYERVVDRLLASPGYGERMAAEWLDVARYADSHGYQDDGMRQMWPWRDWVISAFNRNLPFDTFITWQLAGDLLPEPSQEQLLATGFNRNHMQSQEGGIVPEEYRTEYVVDRVNTFGRAFLGLSVECARCHDHKYDPVTQKEFYQLFSFFNNVNETGQIPYSGVPSPTVIVTTPEVDRQLAALGERIRRVESETDFGRSAFDKGLADWLARRAAASRSAVARPPGLVVHVPLEQPRRVFEFPEPDPKSKEPPKIQERLVFANLAGARDRGRVGDKDRPTTTVPGRFGQAQRLGGDSHIIGSERLAFFERHQPFSVGLWFRLDAAGTAGPLFSRSGGVMNGNRGYEVILRKDGSLTAGLHHVFPDNSIEIETTAPVVTPGVWQQLTLTYDGSSRAAGIRVFVDGRLAPSRILIDHLRRSIIYAKDKGSWGKPGQLLLGRRHDETLDGVTVDDLRVFDRRLTSLEIAALSGGDDPLGAALGQPAGDRDPATAATLREHYLLRIDPQFAERQRTLTTLRGEENALLTSQEEVMIMRERAEPRPTFVLARGAYDAPTEPVSPATPQALGPLAPDLPANRLGLARWLVAPTHPLASRVVVNRYWALLFGRGLVPSVADFGSQGRLPSHPELLDYLATTFVEGGWDLKLLLKEIVTSATYQQASSTDPGGLERDPSNEWLARGPSYRLAAEQIRDAALAVSGLLAAKIGGPSVYPYQPPGLWEALATRNETTYEQGSGDDLYRRSLYTVWKRSSPPPSAISLDAAERLVCTVNRQRTSTPLQALVLLNDPQYVEAARVLATRIAASGGATPAERITTAFRTLTSRPPAAEELLVLMQLYDDEVARFRADTAAARELLAVGDAPPPRSNDPAELAALTIVASTVMNFDEALVKR